MSEAPCGPGAAGGRGRVHVRVRGIVQGVGFRPFVYRLAREEGVTGHVLNDEQGVVIEAEGAPASLERMLARLTGEAPSLAMIERVERAPMAPVGSGAFEIRGSTHGGNADAAVAPDSATCDDCLSELWDPSDRRHRYPFINCTNCGPRFTIVCGVPYDRPLTTMAGFAMCPDCEREYRDPSDRRFHAQPNACPVCGPRARLVAGGGGGGDALAVSPADDPITATARLIGAGAIVAVKGLGGYHLACDATQEAAVRELRGRKHREQKPFALMVATIQAASRVVVLTDSERALMTEPARPIVLARRRDRQPGAPPIASAVAPEAPELGVMLAYTPLHHLLLADVTAATGHDAVLVITSGNVSDEPIAYTDDDARERLAPIADALLVHDRPIHSRVDDSVARSVALATGSRRQLLRRARGYVPSSLPLARPASRPILACGADLKSTFCLARGGRAIVSHHIGDLEHVAARIAYETEIERLQQLLEITPELVVCDLHPGYASTAYAQARDDVALLGVQHHHAHLAACLAEQRSAPERVVGAIYDGTGYGTDGTVWGGEILVGGLAGSERVARLRPVRLAGGAAAIREPWRMACAWLRAAADGEVPPVPRTLVDAVDARQWRGIARIAEDPALSPTTTSMGRLFDAAAALCGIAPRASYEGQAAVELMARVSGERPRSYELPVVDGDVTRWEIDPRPLIAAIAADASSGIEVGVIAAGFHRAVASATADVCERAARDAGLDAVALSGGVWQNPLLLADVVTRLEQRGLRALTHGELPPNDGGIAFGQAAIGAASLRLDGDPHRTGSRTS